MNTDPPAPVTDPRPVPAASMRAVVAGNPVFRRLWLAELISLAGDWFTVVTLNALLLELTGRGETVAWAIIARTIPSALVGPLAGAVADRVPRRTILLVSDALRFFVVLGYLAVVSTRSAPLAYAVVFVHMSIGAFFEPAFQASVQSVVPREQLVAATTLSGITWSAMLAFGALAGGLVSEFLSREAAFVIDAATYLVSFAIVWGTRIPVLPPRPASSDWKDVTGLRDLQEGLSYAAENKGLRRIILAKSGWGIGGGAALLLYNVFGERVVPYGGIVELGIALLFVGRGFGALTGPLVARRIGGDGEPFLEKAIGACYFVMVAAYVAFALAPTNVTASLALFFAHAAISTIWVFSASLVSLRVPDALRGRAIAVDMALFTLFLAISTWVGGVLLDRFGVDPRHLMLGVSAVLVLPGVLWSLTSSNAGTQAKQAGS